MLHRSKGSPWCCMPNLPTFFPASVRHAVYFVPDRATGSQGRSRVSSLDMWLPEAAVAPPPPAASPAGPLPLHEVAIRLQAASRVHRQHRWHFMRTLSTAACRARMLCAADCPRVVSLETMVLNGATGPAAQPGHGPTAGHERGCGGGRSAGHAAHLDRRHTAGAGCRPPGADPLTACTSA